MSTRVFVSEPCAPGARITLAPEESRHLALVLRMTRGTSITVVSDRVAWRATLEAVRPDRVSVTIAERCESRGELPVAVTVMQALPKGTKMDEIVEKLTQLGASRIVPVRCERSCGGESAGKLARWRRIARSAAAQSQRLAVPEVDACLDFTRALDRMAREARVLVAWEAAPHGSLSSALGRAGQHQPIALAVGPEGSFTEAEVDAAKRLQCDFVSLGPTTLRTETAAAAAIAAIAALRNWW